jgi:tetratricopeptide (TPR) repeat protein
MVMNPIRSFLKKIQKSPINENFGFTKSDPILTNDIKGELGYLSSLRCPCKEPFMFHRLGALVKESNHQQAIDCYELKCRNNIHHYFLYLDLYNKENSKNLPKGLTFNTPEGIGYNFFLPDFDSLSFEQMPSKKSDHSNYLPNDPRRFLEMSTYLSKGKEFLDRKDYPNAIQCFDNVLKVDWKWDQAWFLKFRALKEQENIDGALRWCKKGRILFSNNMFCASCEEFLKDQKNDPHSM